MASGISIPTSGAYVSGFASALARGREEDRLDREFAIRQAAADQARQLGSYQVEEAAARAGQRRALPGAISALYGATPDVTETAPARPASTLYPSDVQPIVAAPESNPEAGGYTGVTTPAQPAATVSTLSRSTLGKQLSPEQLAVLTTTAEGRNAMQDRGVLSEEEAQRRVRMATAREDVKRLMNDAQAHARAGQAVEALFKEAAVYERLGQVEDDPAKAASILEHGKDKRRQAEDLLKNEKDSKLTGEYFQKIDAAMSEYDRRPTLENLTRLTDVVNNEAPLTEVAQQKRALFNGERLTRFAANLQSPAVSEFITAVSQVQAEAAQRGEKMTTLQAMRTVQARNPEVAGKVAQEVMRGKQIAPVLKEFFFGRSDFEDKPLAFAQRSATDQGLTPGTKEWSDRTVQIYQRLTRKEKDPNDPIDRQIRLDLIRREGVASKQVNQIRGQMMGIDRKLGTRSAEDAGVYAKLESDLADAKDELRDIRKRLGEYGVAPDEAEQETRDTTARARRLDALRREATALKADLKPELPKADKIKAVRKGLLSRGYTEAEIAEAFAPAPAPAGQ